jgi:hypothetical protein
VINEMTAQGREMSVSLLNFQDWRARTRSFEDCVLVEATPEGYREKGRSTPPNPPKKQTGQMSEKAFAYPVIANGRLYIRDLETLWVYDIKAK